MCMYGEVCLPVLSLYISLYIERYVAKKQYFTVNRSASALPLLTISLAQSTFSQMSKSSTYLFFSLRHIAQLQIVVIHF